MPRAADDATDSEDERRAERAMDFEADARLARRRATTWSLGPHAPALVVGCVVGALLVDACLTLRALHELIRHLEIQMDL